MRSRIPPWPGSMAPESFTPAPRLIADSTRSPTWAKRFKTTASPSQRASGPAKWRVKIDLLSSARDQPTSAAAMSRLPASEAALPSQLLLGLMRGASLCAAEVAADIEGGRVAGPHDAEQEDQQRGAVLLSPNQRHGGQGQTDVDRPKIEKAESGSTRSSGERKLHTSSRTRLQRPIAGKIRERIAEGRGEEDRDGDQHQSARDRDPWHRRWRGIPRQQVRPPMPLPGPPATKDPLQQEQQNQRDEDGCRDDPFHDLKKDTRGLHPSMI